MSTQAEQNSTNSSSYTALQPSEQLFRTLIENSSDIIALVTAEGIVSYVSPPVTRIMGYIPEDLVGQNFMGLIHSDDLPLIQQTFATILQSPGQSASTEYRVLCKDGSWKWFEGTGVNLLHDAIAHAIVGNFRDITQRKQVEQERDALLKQVQQSESRLRRLMESNIIGVIFSNDAGTITDANDAFLQMVGYTRQELLESKVRWLEMTPQEYLYLDTQGIEEARLHGACTPYEKEYIRKDGGRVPILIGYALLEGTQTDFICFILDLTQRKIAEQAKDDFMSMASHELKTPVTSIKGYTQLLIRKFEKEDMHEPVAYLTRMDNQIDKLTKLIRDLLDVSKIQTGKLDYEERPIDIDTLVRETIESVQQTTTTHTLILHVISQATVLGDSERLSQVLINLLNNAIKYSPQANRVDVRLETSSNTVIISIQDYGVGIAKEHQGKLFERFYRVYENSNKLFPGLGIGLYISYEIVKRHHGEITLTSEEGKGSTFFITLPLAPHPLEGA